MKKIALLILSTVASVQLFAGITIVPVNEKLRINTNDINYRYNFVAKKCEKLDYDYKATIVQWVRQDKANIDEKYVNDAGVSYEISYELNGKEYYMVVADTFGECRLYEDIVIKSMGDLDPKKYANLKEK